MNDNDLKTVTIKHFDAYSANWEKRLKDSFYRKRYDVVKSMVKGSTLVDLGCGTGDYSNLGQEYIGIDNSPSMIEKAKTLHSDKKFILEDVENTSLPDNYADCVIAIGLFEYLETFYKLVEEIWRITKDNGCVICAFQNKEKTNIALRLLYRLKRRKLLKPEGYVKDKRITHRKFTKQDVIGLFNKFKHTQTRYLNFNKVFISEFKCIKK